MTWLMARPGSWSTGIAFALVFWSASAAQEPSAPATLRARIDALARELHPSIVEVRRDIHRNPELGFLAMVLRLGEGRDLATRQKAGEHIFEALSAHLDPVFAASPFALSFDMQINDKETSWKRNNIHDALKVEAAHG